MFESANPWELGAHPHYRIQGFGVSLIHLPPLEPCTYCRSEDRRALRFLGKKSDGTRIFGCCQDQLTKNFGIDPKNVIKQTALSFITD